MAYRASQRYARISPRKVRPLADMVRGKFADEALDILEISTPTRCADAGEDHQECAGQRPGPR